MSDDNARSDWAIKKNKAEIVIVNDADFTVELSSARGLNAAHQDL